MVVSVKIHFKLKFYFCCIFFFIIKWLWNMRYNIFRFQKTENWQKIILVYTFQKTIVNERSNKRHPLREKWVLFALHVSFCSCKKKMTLRISINILFSPIYLSYKLWIYYHIEWNRTKYLLVFAFLFIFYHNLINWLADVAQHYLQKHCLDRLSTTPQITRENSWESQYVW